MATIPTVQQNAFGFRLSLHTDADLTTATSFMLHLHKPGKPPVTLAIELDDTNIVSPASGGVVNYLVQEGDLDRTGTYKVQLFDTTSGRNLPSNIVTFRVKGNV